MPTMSCQNTWRQVESIRNLLQTLRSAVDGTSKTNPEEIKLSLKLNEMSKCELEQRLTNLQACDLSLSTESQKLFNRIKIETKGLVDNMQMNSKNAGCVLSLPVCPTSDLSLWNKIKVLLETWSENVAEYSSTLQSICPHSP